MLSNEELLHISNTIPFLKKPDKALLENFRRQAFLVNIPAGKDVFVEGDHVDAIALLISGGVRVYKIGETGREITLYRFGLGESCILTANAILSQKSFPAIATVEKDAQAVMIPADFFRGWVRQYDEWHAFVFDLLSERLSTVMAVVDEVVFQRMDRRLVAWLLKRAEITGLNEPIRVTHQEIAADLGSSREVMSRLLDDLSKAGLIRSGRGMIEVVDIAGLKERALM